MTRNLLPVGGLLPVLRFDKFNEKLLLSWNFPSVKDDTGTSFWYCTLKYTSFVCPFLITRELSLVWTWYSI